ncbi:Hypothetical predicted protein, partial [Paramuricea clavata]
SPNKCKVNDFISSCSSATELMFSKRNELIYIGDFNLNMLTGPDNPEGPNEDLTEFCDQFCLTNMINKPTRVSKTSKTLIDVILVSKVERFVTSGVLGLHPGMSDHDLVYIVRKQRLPKLKAKSIEF